jgi:hypothetical protein
MELSKALDNSLKHIQCTLIFLALEQMDRWREMLRKNLEREGMLTVFETYYEPVFQNIYTTYMDEFIELMKPQIEKGEELLASLMKTALRQQKSQ